MPFFPQELAVVVGINVYFVHQVWEGGNHRSCSHTFRRRGLPVSRNNLLFDFAQNQYTQERGAFH